MITRSDSTLRGVSPSRALPLLSLLVLSVLTLVVPGFAVNQFLAPAAYTTGFSASKYPFALQAVGNFTGHGQQDIVLLGQNPVGIVIVMPGKGDGSFGAPIISKLTFGMTYTQSPLAVGDFNGDGKLDIAVIDATSQKVGLILGNGNGTFRYQVTTVPVSSGNASLLAAADLNGDGKTDLVFSVVLGSSPSIATIQTFRSNGDGTFQVQTPTSFSLPDVTGSSMILAFGDFNRDGKTDLMTQEPQSGAAIFLLQGNGDGTFQPAKPIASGLSTTYQPSLVAGDFNGDGRLDLASQSKILLGNGDGTFQTPQATAATFQPGVAADFNGDGKLDLLGSYPSCVSLGNGDGTFRAPVCFPWSAYPTSVADVNGDGKLDLLVLQTPGFETVALGRGDGTFPVPSVIPGLLGGTSIALGDFNRDGNADLAVTTCNGSSCTPQLQTVLGNPDGTFQPASAPISGYLGGDVLRGDFNGDGKIDLLAIGSGGVQVFRGNGDGTFLPPVSSVFTASLYCLPMVSDLNHDGRLDLVAASGSDLFALLGNGDGTFGAPKLIGHDFSLGFGFCALAAGDFNGDGKLDIAAFNGRNYVQLFSGNGDGTFGALPSFQTAFNIGSIVAYDFNHDGKLDLAMSALGAVTLYTGNGDGTFAKGKDIISSGGGQMVLADFNGDGLFDLAGIGSNYPFVGLRTASGTFKREVFGSGGFPVSLLSADFNHDGAPDIAVAEDIGVVIYLNTGAVAATLTSSSNPSNVGQPVTFKTTVSPTLRGVIGTPTGTVMFKDGSTVLATVNLASGTATFTTSTLAKGSHAITATYSGDSNFIPKTSSALTQVVQ